MKRTLILSILILNAITLAAIKPNRVYSYTPDKLDLTYEEFKVKTDDGFTLNVWHLPSEGDGTPVIISQSDAGNMGDWLYLGLYLQAYGLDVWMYDYRGFGQSDDFAIVQNQLFHMEFVKDLEAVAKYVYQKTGKSPALLGISMGTIIVNEYLRVADILVSKVVFDGYVADPKSWNDKLAGKGKQVIKTFDCEHISGFFRYPEEYTDSVAEFLK
jgi:pimeloyl-ACP methyl ester carboxylesterase